MCNSTVEIGSVVFNGVKQVVADVEWTLHFFPVVLHMSGCHLYLRCCACFDFVVMSLLSSWDDMDVPVELLADDSWAAKDDKTGFLNVGVDCFSWLY